LIGEESHHSRTAPNFLREQDLKMTSKSETQFSKIDTLKLLCSGLIAGGALVAFYYFADYSLLVRVMGLLVVVGAAVGVTLTTELGGDLLGFLQDSRTELRKVVWPTRAETIQTSIAVILMVIVTAIFLWLLDMLLFWIVRLLTGQGA
jgi:preprotein translocase subunit SecE